MQKGKVRDSWPVSYTHLDSVKRLVEESGYPNMKVIEFAFDARDTGNASDYLPHNYTNNCVVYTGTHDNETLLGWYSDITPEERHMVREYLWNFHDDEKGICRNTVSYTHLKNFSRGPIKTILTTVTKRAKSMVSCKMCIRDRDVTGDTENKPMVIGGGTYAKSLKNIIAFGPEKLGIDYHIHGADEFILVSGMEEAVLVYMEAIKNLLAI